MEFLVGVRLDSLVEECPLFIVRRICLSISFVRSDARTLFLTISVKPQLAPVGPTLVYQLPGQVARLTVALQAQPHASINWLVFIIILK